MSEAWLENDSQADPEDRAKEEDENANIDLNICSFGTEGVGNVNKSAMLPKDDGGNLKLAFGNPDIRKTDVPQPSPPKSPYASKRKIAAKKKALTDSMVGERPEQYISLAESSRDVV